MKENQEEKPRKRVVVEEVGETIVPKEATGEIDEMAAATEVATEIKEESRPENPRIPEKFAPKPAPHPSGGKLKYLWFIIPAILILAALGGGIYVFIKGVSQKGLEATPEPTVYETPVPSPTPTTTPSKVDLSKFTIAIQNGSGIAGEGAKVQALLTKAGFKVASIGNAQTFDYTKTVIEAKMSVNDAFLTQLSNILSQTYVLGDNQALSDKGKTDIIVIVGKTKAQ